MALNFREPPFFTLSNPRSSICPISPCSNNTLVISDPTSSTKISEISKNFSLQPSFKIYTNQGIFRHLVIGQNETNSNFCGSNSVDLYELDIFDVHLSKRIGVIGYYKEKGLYKANFPLDLDVGEKIGIFGCVVLIDYLYFRIGRKINF